MSDGRIVHVFMFDVGEDDTRRGYPGLLDVIAYHTLTGEWPPIPAAQPPLPVLPKPQPKRIVADEAMLRGDALNVRPAPGTVSLPLGGFRPGDGPQVVLEERNVSGAVWYRIAFSGRDGWVSGKYVKLL